MVNRTELIAAANELGTRMSAKVTRDVERRDMRENAGRGVLIPLLNFALFLHDIEKHSNEEIQRKMSQVRELKIF